MIQRCDKSMFGAGLNLPVHCGSFLYEFAVEGGREFRCNGSNMPVYILCICLSTLHCIFVVAGTMAI